jgi:hypothetical protein
LVEDLDDLHRSAVGALQAYLDVAA